MPCPLSFKKSVPEGGLEGGEHRLIHSFGHRKRLQFREGFGESLPAVAGRLGALPCNLSPVTCSLL